MSMFGGAGYGGGGFGGAGPEGFMQAFLGGGAGYDNRFAAPPSSYDEYFKAYSLPMYSGSAPRDHVSYGGKVLMPQSALARLTNLDLESPYIFEIRNTSIEEPRLTHAGVLEFVAEEGRVYIPAWMMKHLQLQEGDAIRFTGTNLPVGKFVKVQAQTADFLELSDPKAVLEQAMRNFTALTPGEIIEIHYNCITFELLIMEIKPEAAPAIKITDTDLEVDFAEPKGYIAPKPVERPPPPTMASKLKIDKTRLESVPPTRTSTPGSVGEGSLSTFKGTGQTLSGRKAKGKKDKPIEALDPFSVVRRTDTPRIVTNDTQLGEKKIPAALNLPFGKLFFGYEVIPVGGVAAATEAAKIPFSGSGTTLSGRPVRVKPEAPSSDPPPTQPESSAGHVLGSGQRLGSGKTNNAVKRPRREREVIEIDSD